MKKTLEISLLTLSLVMLMFVLVGCSSNNGDNSPDVYSLDIYCTDGGTITKSPDKAFYNKGEVVTLTTVPDNDCDFAYWWGSGFDGVRETEILLPIMEDTTLLAYFGSIYTFEDDFSSNDNEWPEGERDNYSLYFENGKYVINMANSDKIVWLRNSFPAIDFDAEVDFQFLSLTKYAEAGFVFNEKDNDNYYLLRITSNGYYSIYVIANDDWHPIQEWSSIDIDLSTYNKIYVQKEGRKYTFFINADYLDEVEVENEIPHIAIMAASGDDVPVTIFYDNYSCTHLDVYSMGETQSIDSNLSEFFELENTEVLDDVLDKVYLGN